MDILVSVWAITNGAAMQGNFFFSFFYGAEDQAKALYMQSTSATDLNLQPQGRLCKGSAYVPTKLFLP